MTLTVSTELAASVQRMRARTELDAKAKAFETGAADTAPARQPSARGSVANRLLPRKCRRRLTDEQRTKQRHRRRMLGGSSALPDTMRHYYTEGERAVLCIVAGEVRKRGVCDLPIDQIAALAGVGRTTVQNAMHEARRLGHIKIIERPQRGRKSLTNLIKIVSAAWCTWLRRGAPAHHRIGSNSPKNMSTTKTRVHKNRDADRVERPEDAWQGVLLARPGPINGPLDRDMGLNSTSKQVIR